MPLEGQLQYHSEVDLQVSSMHLQTWMSLTPARLALLLRMFHFPILAGLDQAPAAERTAKHAGAAPALHDTLKPLYLPELGSSPQPCNTRLLMTSIVPSKSPDLSD